eukprot:CAMPEP_0204597976 /NCGR_PEP_ID=MMETSP0661-20131031/54077_1 /ASSEMBLY_ACC=CAM_ASM_000606 /TAXON_ID=109239 /ORGANISM="Alexandrium margalefi, Strain AMGDE01CS-322" /LENGTH=156 /DNA_ID=CAMNT_0051608673 /DNA_START=119 /DNA_END=590 /DNA_ORIENTATION=-
MVQHIDGCHTPSPVVKSVERRAGLMVPVYPEQVRTALAKEVLAEKGGNTSSQKSLAGGLSCGGRPASADSDTSMACNNFETGSASSKFSSRPLWSARATWQPSSLWTPNSSTTLAWSSAGLSSPANCNLACSTPAIFVQLTLNTPSSERYGVNVNT